MIKKHAKLLHGVRKITFTIVVLTSNEDIKRVGVSWVVIARHGVERTYSQRISIQDEKICVIPTNNKGSCYQNIN
jgi:hypothetical protein